MSIINNMKYLYIILVTFLFIGCSEKRVLVDEVIYKDGVYYFDSEPYTGIIFDIYDGTYLGWERDIKDGVWTGVKREYFPNGQLGIEKDEYTGEENCWKENGEKVECSYFDDPDVDD